MPVLRSPVTYAPVSASAVVIGFNIERSPTPQAPPEEKALPIVHQHACPEDHPHAGFLRAAAEDGYRRILTPVFEDAELFLRTSGEGSDIVQKEMYVFEDQGGRQLALRPEGTAPICRAYVEHGMHREPQPAKLFTIASMYRYGTPGRGRYREHWQASVEAIGSDDPSVDAHRALVAHPRTAGVAFTGSTPVASW